MTMSKTKPIFDPNRKFFSCMAKRQLSIYAAGYARQVVEIFNKESCPKGTNLSRAFELLMLDYLRLKEIEGFKKKSGLKLCLQEHKHAQKLLPELAKMDKKNATILEKYHYIVKKKRG